MYHVNKDKRYDVKIMSLLLKSSNTIAEFKNVKLNDVESKLVSLESSNGIEHIYTGAYMIQMRETKKDDFFPVSQKRWLRFSLYIFTIKRVTRGDFLYSKI